MINYFPTATPPDGWLICNGQAVNRANYPGLFAVAEASGLSGPLFGVGNGTTTFNVPDLRGEFIRGADMGRGVDTGRVIGSAQTEDVKAHGHSGTTNSTGAHIHPYNVVGFTSGAEVAAGTDWALFLTGDTTTSSGTHSHTVTIASSGGTESRPRNIALVPCIKT